MIAQTNGKSECPLLFALSKTSSKPNFVKYSLTQAMVPIGTDLLLFGSRTNVLSRNCFVVIIKHCRSGHFYLTASIHKRQSLCISFCRAQVSDHIVFRQNRSENNFNFSTMDFAVFDPNSGYRKRIIDIHNNARKVIKIRPQMCIWQVSSLFHASGP